MEIQFLDLSAQQIVYVDSAAMGRNTVKDGVSWETAFFDLQDALAVADSGDQVWVAKGTYYPIECSPCDTTQRETSFNIKNGIRLLGGFSGLENTLFERKTDSVSLHYRNRTSLSGNIGNSNDSLDNSVHIIFISNVDSTTTIDGFTIAHGNANIQNPPPPDCFGFCIGGGIHSDGAGIYATESNYVLKNCIISLNYARAGGGIFNFKSHPFITNCFFYGNGSWQGGGGAINDSLSNPLITNCIFYKNFSEFNSFTGSLGGGGGGIHNWRSDPRITNCHFIENSEVGITNYESGPTLGRCKFIENSEGILNRFSNPRISSCLFVRNKRFGIFNYASSSIVFECTFSENMEGGVSNDVSDGDVFTNCTFFLNCSSNFGGAVSNDGSDVEFYNCQFISNSSESHGGAVYNMRSNPIFEDCLFSNNRAGSQSFYAHNGFGGGMYNFGSNPVLNNCSFFDNIQRGMHNELSSPKLTKCIFRGNTAPINRGGGMYNEISAPILTDCLFEKNSANHGGGIYNNASNPILSRCNFISNEASIGNSAVFTSGGAISSNNLSNLQITNCTFTSNLSEGRGGALYFSNSSSSISNCSIGKNRSEIGGGISLDEGDLNFLNCTIRNNSASEGGGISFLSGNIDFLACTIIFNNSNETGAIGVHTTNSLREEISDNQGRILFQNSIVAYNSPNEFKNTNRFELIELISRGHNIISDTTNSGILSLPTDILGNQISPMDPLLDNSENDDRTFTSYEFLPNSLARGKGIPLDKLPEELFFDRRGYSRKVGSSNDSVDIGAIEYQETQVLSGLTQICENEEDFVQIQDIVLVDSTGGAWRIDSNQQIVLAFADGVSLNADSIQFQFIGEGLDSVAAFISENKIYLTYSKSYAVEVNEIRISGLKVNASKGPGIYNLHRLSEGNAKQNGNAYQDSIIHAQIWILPALTNAEFPYNDSFESCNSLWQPDSKNSLWQRGLIEGFRINLISGDQSAWATNLTDRYPANIHSWLYSPCMDLMTLRSPTISLDYWSDAEIGLDGAVIQTSVDRGETWRTLGSDSTGINWYDTNLLLSNPGNQPIDKQFGWTGEKGEWLRASHRFPDSLKSPITRFRLAFRSSDFINPTKNLKGFAFDNFYLGERYRGVLIENFPSAGTTNFEEMNSSLYQAFQRDIISIVYLDDNQNHPDVNARKAIYGISNSGIIILEGVKNFQPVSSLTYRSLDTSSLRLSPFRIQIEPAQINPFSVKVDIKSLEDWETPVNIHIAILENGIIRGEDTLNHILRKFLPGPQGLRKNDWQKGEIYSLTQTWSQSANPLPSIVEDLDSLYVIVFIQDPTTKEIYQAARIGMDSGFTVSKEPTIEEGIKIFPNPAGEKLYLHLKNYSQTIQLVLRNMKGQVTETLDVPPNHQIYEWNLPDLAHGVYVLELQNQKRVLKREKIVISH